MLQTNAEIEETDIMAGKTLRSTLMLLMGIATTAGVWAGAAHAYNPTIVTIVNSLEQKLVFEEVKNREHIRIDTAPPAEIPAGSSGQFKIELGQSYPYHLNIKYTIDGTSDLVGVVYRRQSGGDSHCPKVHPDWVTEEVRHCGNFGHNNWSYTFSPAQ